MDYHAYLQSEDWRIQRLKAIKRASGRCVLCNRGFNEYLKCIVHHRTYQSPYGSLEELDNLVCLCEECHTTFHSFFSYSSKTKAFYLGGDKRIGRPVQGHGDKVSIPKRKKKQSKTIISAPMSPKSFLREIDGYYSKGSKRGCPQIDKLFKAKRDFIQKYNKYNELVMSGVKPTARLMRIPSRQVGCLTWYYRRGIFGKSIP